MVLCMRTTLTLAPDVASRLNQLRAQEGRGLKELVNEALRRGLDEMERKDREPSQPYRTTGWDLGRTLVPGLDDVAEALVQAEGEGFR